MTKYDFIVSRLSKYLVSLESTFVFVVKEFDPHGTRRAVLSVFQGRKIIFDHVSMMPTR